MLFFHIPDTAQASLLELAWTPSVEITEFQRQKDKR